MFLPSPNLSSYLRTWRREELAPQSRLVLLGPSLVRRASPHPDRSQGAEAKAEPVGESLL